MKLRYLLLPLLLATAAHAEIHSSFKNFSTGKEGTWESTTTMLDGPQKGKVITSKTCVNAAQSKAAADKAMAASAAVKNCATKVTSDTAELASSDQVCTFGAFSTHMTTTMKKLDANSFETTITNDTGGMTTHMRTVSKYTGPCMADPTASTSTDKASSSQCSECTANITKMKANCDSQPAQQKAVCASMIPQMEAACKMGC